MAKSDRLVQGRPKLDGFLIAYCVFAIANISGLVQTTATQRLIAYDFGDSIFSGMLRSHTPSSFDKTEIKDISSYESPRNVRSATFLPWAMEVVQSSTSIPETGMGDTLSYVRSTAIGYIPSPTTRGEAINTASSISETEIDSTPTSSAESVLGDFTHLTSPSIVSSRVARVSIIYTFMVIAVVGHTFPSVRRHRALCSTMPWDIPPALMVLWGVCWMFYTPPSTPRADELETSIDVSFFNTPYVASAYTQRSSLAQGSPDWVGQGWDWAAPAFETLSDLLHPNDPGHAFINLESYAVEGQNSVNMPPQTFMLSPGELFQQPPADGKDHAKNTPKKPSHDIRAHTVAHVSSEDSLLGGHHDLEEHRTTVPASERRSSIFTSRTGPVMKVYTSTENSLRPPRQSGNSLRCNENGCKDLIFQYKSDLERHINKHTRPFRCDVIGCTRVDGFGSKGLLQRHMQMHRQALPSTGDTTYQAAQLYCPVPSCDRSSSHPSSRPFTRKDNRDDHVSRRHGSRPGRTPTTTLAGALAIMEDGTSNELGPAHRQSSTSHVQATTRTFGKRKRMETNENIEIPSPPIAAVKCTHQTEIEDLKGKVKILKRELAASREKEEALFAALIQATKPRSENSY